MEGNGRAILGSAELRECSPSYVGEERGKYAQGRRKACGDAAALDSWFGVWKPGGGKNRIPREGLQDCGGTVKTV